MHTSVRCMVRRTTTLTPRATPLNVTPCIGGAVAHTRGVYLCLKPMAVPYRPSPRPARTGRREGGPQNILGQSANMQRSCVCPSPLNPASPTHARTPSRSDGVLRLQVQLSQHTGGEVPFKPYQHTKCGVPTLQGRHTGWYAPPHNGSDNTRVVKFPPTKLHSSTDIQTTQASPHHPLSHKPTGPERMDVVRTQRLARYKLWALPTYMSNRGWDMTAADYPEACLS